MRPIASYLNKTSLANEGFITWERMLFSCSTQQVIPSGQDSAILPAGVANHSIRYGSSCPLMGLAT